MPHIRMRALSKEQVATLSQKMLQNLAGLIETGEDNFTFEKIDSQFFYGGKEVKSYPFIEVFWFERPKEVQDRTAAYITEQVKALVPHEDVAVVFRRLEPSEYYENGRHF
jgi:hypothetical protein